jgi:DNA polymerase elongation subunit (family B)
MLPRDFYDNVEKPGALKHILYGDTDSLYVVIPAKNSDKMTTQEKLVIADKVSEDINSAVTRYLNEYFLPKSNISIDQNSTYFKTEMLIQAIMFLDVKKNYAFKLEAKKGKILDKPEVSYTGIQVVRSNAAKLTQDMLREIIENVVLNDKLNNKERLPKVSEIVNRFHDKFLENIDTLDLENITIPGKWSKAEQYINGMTLYNFIMKKEVFSLGSAGNFIYCIFRNKKLFQGSNLDMDKTKGLVIPQKYDKLLLDKKLNEYQIQIDSDLQWDTLFSTTVGRIVDLVKLTK